LIILQTNRREDFDIVGYGECPGCKTENNHVTILLYYDNNEYTYGL